MRVLLAFDKFKDSLTAAQACDIAAQALRARHPDWQFDRCPLADGGEGFCEILSNSAGGHIIASSVPDPLGDIVQARVGFVPMDRIPGRAHAMLDLPTAATVAAMPVGARRITPSAAIIEMATASGLALLDPSERNPWLTSSNGTGELLRTASELGAQVVVLGIGGSATNDVGLGALAALGLEFRAANGDRIDPPIPRDFARIAEIGGRLSATLPPVRIACDVTNPLLGPNGATAIYGPQKGLRAADVNRLDRECARLARMLCEYCGKPERLTETPGTGAAGGISFGLMAAADAKLLPGFDLVSAWLDLDARLAEADIVITGEGRFDNSSLSGKGPGAVAAKALALGKRVHVFAGQSSVAQAPAGLSIHAITPPGTELGVALHTARQNLSAALQRAL